MKPALAISRAAAPPAGFDPSSVGTVKLWLKADALSLADGDPVSTWADSSGNGKDATGTLTTRPLYKANILNGKPVVRFDGTDDVLTGVSLTAPKHFFAVAKYSAASFAAYDGLLTDDGSGGGNSGVVLIGTGGDTIFYDAALGADYYKDGTAHGAAAMSAPMNAFGVLSISSDLDGFANPFIYRLGTDRANGGRHWNGDVAEILVYGSVLSAGNRQAVQTYLGAKYGITIA